MVIGIVFTAILILNAALFVFARRSNRRVYQKRMNAALRVYVNSTPRNEWTKANGR